MLKDFVAQPRVCYDTICDSLRYANDTFVVSCKNYGISDFFYSFINNVLQSIKFAVEHVVHTSVSFLNLLIIYNTNDDYKMHSKSPRSYLSYISVCKTQF